jgi:hypothetical protein
VSALEAWGYGADQAYSADVAPNVEATCVQRQTQKPLSTQKRVENYCDLERARHHDRQLSKGFGRTIPELLEGLGFDN